MSIWGSRHTNAVQRSPCLHQWDYLHHLAAVAEVQAPVFAVAVARLVLSPRSSEAKSALCSSFIRQMSPSQAMNNHSTPSVRLHPPGLVCSLLCFCSLSWLGTHSLPTQAPFRAWHADALSLSGSISLRLSLPFPTALSSFSSLPTSFSSL